MVNTQLNKREKVFGKEKKATRYKEASTSDYHAKKYQIDGNAV